MRILRPIWKKTKSKSTFTRKMHFYLKRVTVIFIARQLNWFQSISHVARCVTIQCKEIICPSNFCLFRFCKWWQAWFLKTWGAYQNAQELFLSLCSVPIFPNEECGVRFMQQHIHKTAPTKWSIFYGQIRNIKQSSKVYFWKNEIQRKNSNWCTRFMNYNLLQGVPSHVAMKFITYNRYFNQKQKLSANSKWWIFQK